MRAIPIPKSFANDRRLPERRPRNLSAVALPSRQHGCTGVSRLVRARLQHRKTVAFGQHHVFVTRSYTSGGVEQAFFAVEHLVDGVASTGCGLGH